LRLYTSKLTCARQWFSTSIILPYASHSLLTRMRSTCRGHHCQLAMQLRSVSRSCQAAGMQPANIAADCTPDSLCSRRRAHSPSKEWFRCHSMYTPNVCAHKARLHKGRCRIAEVCMAYEPTTCDIDRNWAESHVIASHTICRPPCICKDHRMQRVSKARQVWTGKCDTSMTTVAALVGRWLAHWHARGWPGVVPWLECRGKLAFPPAEQQHQLACGKAVLHHQ
jgi:hypothetical protein